RVSKLEAKMLAATPEPTAIYVCSLAQKNGDNACRRLQSGDQTWDRLDNESEDDFKARAMRHTDPNQLAKLFFVY
ncbi:MAG: hypothetical protein ABIW85_00290, partial [Variovorax sp.]